MKTRGLQAECVCADPHSEVGDSASGFGATYDPRDHSATPKPHDRATVPAINIPNGLEVKGW